MRKLMNLKGVKELEILRQKKVNGGGGTGCFGSIPHKDSSFLRPECLSNRECMFSNQGSTCCNGKCV